MLGSDGPESRSTQVSPGRLVGYGLSALAATTVGTWALAELATPDGVSWVSADLGGLGRTVGLIAAAAVGVPAAVLAYHRQRALDTANQVAANQHDHKVITDNREHKTGVERNLRERYTTCAEQLGSENFAIRLAGIYALASLADDWHELGNDSERQVCIDLLCAYLRTQRRAPIAGPRLDSSPREEREVRAAIVNIIHARTQVPDAGWAGCGFELADVYLPEVNLVGINLDRVNLVGAELTAARLSNANLRTASLVGANLSGANLTGANLSGGDLSEVNLTGADLFLTDLSGANLPETDLSGANLTGANLFGANLSEADLSDANLSGANLSGANLPGAILSGANLSGADLSAAILFGADLIDANLTDANLFGANLTKCDHSTGTKWPAGFTPPAPLRPAKSRAE